MSKARVDWTFGETPVGSSKLDQIAIDAITPGLPIWCISKDIIVTAPSGAGSAIQSFYPYSPSKSVFDRLYLVAWALVDGVDRTQNFQLSFDSGGSWTAAFPSVAVAPVSFGGVATTLAETWNLDSNVVGFQWIGLRNTQTAFTTDHFLRLVGFLFSSDDDPF